MDFICSKCGSDDIIGFYTETFSEDSLSDSSPVVSKSATVFLSLNKAKDSDLKNIDFIAIHCVDCGFSFDPNVDVFLSKSKVEGFVS